MNRRRDQIEQLAVWIEGRLGDREAVQWAVSALERIGERSGAAGIPHRERLAIGIESDAAIVALIERLAVQAERGSALSADIKLIWRMLKQAAKDGSGLQADQSWWVEDYRRRIAGGRFGVEHLRPLIDLVRPRLKAIKPYQKPEAGDDDVLEPRRWVRWDFKAASGPLERTARPLDARCLAALSTEMLISLLDVATTELGQAIRIAREIDWGALIYAVRRVVAPPPPVGVEGDDETDHDPDCFNDDFAPLVRLITAAFDALAVKDAVAAARTASRWSGAPDGLFLRMAAHAAANPAVCDGTEAATLLEAMIERPFWDASRYPEIAKLRVLRWPDFPAEARERLSSRMLAGPRRAEFLEGDWSDEWFAYVHDLEMARVVDQGLDVPAAFARAVAERRAREPEFPHVVESIEGELPNLRMRPVPDGDPAVFEGVPLNDLIERLVDHRRLRFVGEGDDATAYARRHRARLLEALRRRAAFDAFARIAWELLLSWPHDKAEDPAEARRVAEGIASLALARSPEIIPELTDRVCYWLDATDEQHRDFAGAMELWMALLPHASAIENAPAPEPEADQEISREDAESITSAALNAPLGHLLSFFLRRCPSMPPAERERPPLPADLVDPLKCLTGRARALVANRLAVHANYFLRADRAWLETFALAPMRADTVEGRQLWEAFARYAQFPSPALWEALRQPLLSRLRPMVLSDEAQSRLAEIAIAAWWASKMPEPAYSVDAPAIRHALSIGTERVRAAASWGFLRLLRRREDPDDEGAAPPDAWSHLGAAFFAEIWPMEPTLQSGKTADEFARVPVAAGAEHFADAVRTVLPYLRPFEVWDADNGFGLDETADPIVTAHPAETLALIDACVGEDWGMVYRLDRVLRLIREARPDLGRDPRLRRLYHHAEEGR